ncbi:MAG: phosphoribosylformylglycinamidine synthase subunit PurQ, partial [Thermodesulfovibrionia bacterium]|nr:phosphoribosylformylglycinamidine synthase subunit PurQ [Thermodesulfovibrionia bacterium]
ANWMWAAKLPGEGAKLLEAAEAMRDIMVELGIAVDGGKDSLSMAAQAPHPLKEGTTETVKSPGTLVISAYVTCPDITKIISPDIKKPGTSKLLSIDLGQGKNRLGGTALAHVFNQLGNESPDVDDPELLKRAFNTVQVLISQDLILSGHDRSDGGLIITLLEMAFAGNCGLNIDIKDSARAWKTGSAETTSELQRFSASALAYFFSEELGLVLEYLPEHEETLCEILQKASVPFSVIGNTSDKNQISILFNGKTILNEDMRVLRDIWEETSYRLDRLQANPECVEEERNVNSNRRPPHFILTFSPEETPSFLMNGNAKPRVAVVRDEGSNSDREMTSAFFQAGFETWDITMMDILAGTVNLNDFKGIAFVGGFSYADVLDSAKGWAGVIRFNKKIWDQFQEFYNRKDSFSLGVCNGCQLMALLGWVPWQGIANELQPRFIHDISGRFESRFPTVKILAGPSIMLSGMEGSVLGIWVAHGEGRAYCPDMAILKKIETRHLAPVRYIDDNNEITAKYPFNPNGSTAGIAALCSPDGRHLAIMPHPERTFLTWQWPWMPEEWRKNLKASPWLKMFQNARKWCE